MKMAVFTVRRYNPEDSHLHTRRRENLKSYFTPCCLTIIALMMKAVSTSETSANFYQTTQHNIPEHSQPYEEIM
jgi:hypothetical protein